MDSEVILYAPRGAVCSHNYTLIYSYVKNIDHKYIISVIL